MFDNFKKKIAKGAVAASKGISKAVGAGDLVDYAGSKMAKRAAAPAAKKFVDDKTSGVRAAISGAVAASSVLGGAGLTRGLAKTVASSLTKKAVAKRTVANILKKHKGGGDAKMLEGIKQGGGAHSGLPKKLSVKSNRLDATSDGRVGFSITRPAKLKLQTKRTLLKQRLNAQKKESSWSPKNSKKGKDLVKGERTVLPF